MSQLQMRRADLRALPIPQLPAGYLIRRASVRDAPAIAAVISRAFEPSSGAPVTVDEVVGRLFLHPISRGVLVVVQEPQEPGRQERVVATATVGYLPDRFGDVGYVHWVATDPDHAGLGLGRAVTAAVLTEFDNLGLVAAVLETDDHRLPAITSYSRLGFRPVLHQRDHPARWDAVRTALAGRDVAL